MWLAAGLLLAGCAGGSAPARPTPAAPDPTRPTTSAASPSAARGGPTASPSTASSTTARPTGPRLDTWRVGARPLPLRADGFGQVRSTPRELRVRRLATVDRLPAPRDGRFHASVRPITPALRARMGQTWTPGCPVPWSGLRYLTLSFHGFDGRAHTGELVVNAAVARDVVSVFRRLYAASYPVEEMRLPTTADLTAAPTGDGNNTAAYVCRFTRGTTTLSAHAFGLAVDVNPFVNPYERGDLVLPELAGSYTDRSWRRPGMIVRGDVVTAAFADVGWTWGGDFRSVSDPMHFSADGR